MGVDSASFRGQMGSTRVTQSDAEVHRGGLGSFHNDSHQDGRSALHIEGRVRFVLRRTGRLHKA